MTKKLLPAMIGVALAGSMSVVAADVTVFGHIDTSIVNYDIDQDPAANAGINNISDTNFVCTTCSIGFKGSEDLGNGLKAIFKLDFQYDTTVRNDGDGSGADGDNNNSGLLDRDQWVGLAGGFGQVRIGTISTVYKSHGAMIDPLYRTVGQGRDVGLQSEFHSGAGEELQGRATNTLRWDSANYNGFKVGFHYTLDSNELDGGGEDNDPYGIGGSYENGGILVFADYMDNNGDATIANEDVSAWKVGGKYTMNDFAVMGQYEDGSFDDGTAGGDGDATVWHIGGSYTMGNNLLYVAYGQGNADFPGFDQDYDVYSVAGVHSMSKRTSVYAEYSAVDCDADISDSPCEGVDPANGGDLSAFALGVKHKF
jgi:predicted porin